MLSSNLKKPGLVFSGLDIDKTLENEFSLNFTRLPSNVSVLNHRFPGFLTNFSRIIKQYSFLVRSEFALKYPKKIFPSFGIALTRPLPVSLIQEFRSLSVPLVALVDSDTDCVDDIMFPVISSEASHRSSFVILRAALRGIKYSFKFRKLANYLMLRRRYKFFFRRFNRYLSKKYWHAKLPLGVYKRSRRWLRRYKRIRLFRFKKRHKRALFFFNALKRRTRKNWFAAYKAACPGQVKKVGKNAFTLLLLRRASRKLFWTRKNKKRLIKKRRKVVLLRKKKGILLKGMRRFFKKNKKRIKNKRWVRYKDKESSYKMIKFYDADFTGRLFTHKTKAFREKGVFYVRQNRKLTWKLANTINPYKLRRRRRGFRTIAFLMKQRIKLFYRHLSERQLRRLFANARHRQRKILKRQTSYVMRLLERRLDNAVFRTGFFKMSEVKQYIKRNGVFINGHLCKRLNRKLSVGDIITFHKNFKVKQRFALFLRRQYPYTKYERGDRSVWNKKGLRFNFKLGIF